MESYSKTNSNVETPRRGVCEQLPFLSPGLCAQNILFSQEDYDYLLAQRITEMWMSSKRCQLQGEGVSPTSLVIAENKQNIVTGHLEHERTLKSNNYWTGLGPRTRGGKHRCVTSVNKPPRFKTGDGKE